ncbi:MAG: OsmC family protein [Epsilonproteobacteria bacterium]|nr:OsmC family protein [Campylobacterota bacterium]
MISIRHIEGHRFEATNGKEVIIVDADKFSPVQHFITGLGNCTLFDVVDMAQKKGFEIEASIDVEYKRKDTFPKIFTEFHFIYKLKSNAQPIDAKRWVLSSLETYCSTINTVRATSKIFYTIILNDDTVAYKESIISGRGEMKLESFADDDEGYGCACCNA